MDIFLGHYRLQPNALYENLGGGEFEERGLELGLAGHATWSMGDAVYGHTIGAAFGDLNGDGRLDAVVGNLAHPRFFHFSDKTQVLLADGDGFTDVAGGDRVVPDSPAGLRYQETHSSPVLGDFDADGVLDLVLTATYPGRPAELYWGAGDGTFEMDTYRSGIRTTDGWGAAAADVDLDGDLDLVTDQLLINRLEPVDHWAQVHPVGTDASNRAGIGATVFLSAGGTTQIRFVQGASGQGCQDSASLHFGLGEETVIDRVEVEFPGAGRVVYEGPFDADQRLWVMENGSVEFGWRPPVLPSHGS